VLPEYGSKLRAVRRSGTRPHVSQAPASRGANPRDDRAMPPGGPALREVSGGGDDGEMISGSELTAAARAVGAIRRALKRPDPVAVLKRRQAVRQELEDNLRLGGDSTPEVVVIQLGKEDKYPEADERLISWSASPCFKFEVKACQDRGLAVYSSIQHVRVRRSRARPVADEDARKVFVVGRIPYERISFMDWNAANDPAYWLPRSTWRTGGAGRSVRLSCTTCRAIRATKLSYTASSTGPRRFALGRCSTGT
jgi:hypothetical protein